MYTDVHFSSGATSQPKAKIVVAVVGVVVVPFTDDAVLRVIVPAAAAFDAVITGSGTFFCPYRLTLRLLLICKAIEMTFIVFVDPLRKKLVWALLDFVKIQ